MAQAQRRWLASAGMAAFICSSSNSALRSCLSFVSLSFVSLFSSATAKFLSASMDRKSCAARTASEARDTADEALPPLREEEAIAGSILQRLQVERDSLNDREARAVKAIETLGARIEQLSRDIERETGLKTNILLA